MTEKNELFIQLPDGRKLAYAEYGLLEGKPVIYCHGNPGSRLDPGMIDPESLVEYKVRLIAPDRPGMGLSDFQPGRKIGDWPADVIALADALGLDRFAVLGISGGGPYAEVCAWKIPQRLTTVAVVSGAGPFDAPGVTKGMGQGKFYLGAARLHPRLAEAFLGMMKSGMKNAKMSEMPGMPAADLAILAKPGFAERFLATAFESMHQGTHGTAWDATIAARPWDFCLGEIAMPVHLWQGEVDRNVPPAMARFVAQSIPDCRAKFYPDEGHLSLLEHHFDEVLQTLVA
jgi:pimeloyl-ACP methyl ester carboxylesterase